MIDLFEYVKKIFPCFDTSGITELKIIDKKYIKYKKNKKWERVRIKNFDLREKSYHTFETLLKNLFEEVGYEFHKVPIICEKERSFFYFPSSFRSKRTYFIENVPYGKKLLSIFEKRYTGVKRESTTVLGLHVGEGSLLIYIGSELEGEEGKISLDKLKEDILTLHKLSFERKLSDSEITNLVREYYPEVFPKPVQTLSLQPQSLHAQSEVKDEVVSAPKEKVKVKIHKRKIEEKEVREVRERITLEKVKEIPYDKVKEIVSSYSPPTCDFHGRRVKIEYEMKIEKNIDEEKRKEMDYLLCWFILSSEKAEDKGQLATEFCNQIRKL